MQPARLGAWVSCLVSTALVSTLVALPSSAQTVDAVETSQQTNDRIRALSAASRALPPHDYVIGNGDLLGIQVFDVQELSREVRVSQTGTIGIPLVPVRLHVSGLTETQAQRKIAEVLETNGLVSHPDVSVTVKERKSKPITIVGAVPHSMVYQADRQVTLIEVLAEAGGISNDAGDTVIITRLETDPASDSEPPAISSSDAASTPLPKGMPNSASTAPGAPSDSSSSDATARTAASISSSSAPAKSTELPDPVPPPVTNTITVNLSRILETGDTSSNIVLQPGDVVTVPHAGIVYALGAVTRPGGFVVSNDRGQLTTLKLLALAGGLERTAKSDRAVIVRHDSNGQQHEVEVDLKKVMKFEAEDIRLQPSDILYIPKSVAKQALIKTAELSFAIGSAVAIYRVIR
ncbi:MAG TPA: polysaccharide biosynthesis/export family protein [Candidatus Acidoferrum sp.]